MRAIKVSFRAVFEGPQGPLNPLNLNISGPFPVELFGNLEVWKLREIQTARRVVYDRLSKFASVDHGKQVTQSAFRRQLEPWQMWGIPPGVDNYNPPGTERLLLPEEIHECAGGVYQFRGPEDFTHIGTEIHGNIVTTLCEARVSSKLIVSTRANIAPTCPTCAGIYKEKFATV